MNGPYSCLCSEARTGVTNVVPEISLATGAVPAASLVTGAVGALSKRADSKWGTVGSCRFLALLAPYGNVVY